MKSDQQQKSRRRFIASTGAMAGWLLLQPTRESLGQKGKPSRMNSVKDPWGPVMMSDAASEFVRSLTTEQIAKLSFALDDDQRYDWHYVPKARKGIPIKELSPDQRHLVNILFNAALSPRGFMKVMSIMSLEPVLRELEQRALPVRDPELYYVSLFGNAGSKSPWGWRLEGHHISLNYTLIDNDHVSTTPCFLGANPAEVQHGNRRGFRALAAEEDLARLFVKSLDDKHRAQAVVAESAPGDIVSVNSRKANPIRPAGLAAKMVGDKQAGILMDLLREYAFNTTGDLAAARLERIRAAGFGDIHFAWAGSLEKSQPHYYRIQGPSFLIEYDNVQNHANHIHSVWRDFNGDFGSDLLANHYKEAHSGKQSKE